jgi:hypothetical protein
MGLLYACLFYNEMNFFEARCQDPAFWLNYSQNMVEYTNTRMSKITHSYRLGWKKWCVLGAVLFIGHPFAAPLMAQEAMTSSEREKSDNVLALLRESKLEETHYVYWLSLAAQMPNQGALNRVEAGYDPALARKEMIKFLVKHYNPGLFRESMRWLKDPMTQQYLQLQNAPWEGFEQFKQTLAKTPLPAKRRTLVSRAFEATSGKLSTEHMYKLTVMAAGASEQSMSVGSLDLFADLAYRKYASQVQKDAYDRLAYIFSSLTDPQLEGLIFHIEDPIGLWSLQLMRGALYSAIYVTLQNVARQPANVVPSKLLLVPEPEPAVTGETSGGDLAPEPVAPQGSDLLD